MITPSKEIMPVLGCFMQVFSERTWDWVQVLVLGTILAPGKRTVTAVLTVVGLSQEKQYQRYHRVLNRATWSSLAVSKILLGLLVTTFVASGGTVVLAADETLERRKGKKIKQKGVFRDAVRSSQKYTVKAFGLRWVSMMILVNMPWSTRVWALPFLTVLAPNERVNAANGKRHKTSIDWLMQMMSQVYCWLPNHQLVLVVDGGLIALKLGHRCLKYANPVTLVARFRIDAQLYDFVSDQPKSKSGPKPKKGDRQPSLKDRLTDHKTIWQTMTIAWYGGNIRTLEIVSGKSLWYSDRQKALPICWVLVRDPFHKLKPAAFLCTDLDATPQQILTWYVMRWNVEVTFEDARAHLGLETQRQWNDLAITRTTPALLGLYSFVVLLAQHLLQSQPLPVHSTAWYIKDKATFSDVIAFVRLHLWTHTEFTYSHISGRHTPIFDDRLQTLLNLLSYAA